FDALEQALGISAAEAHLRTGCESQRLLLLRRPFRHYRHRSARAGCEILHLAREFGHDQLRGATAHTLKAFEESCVARLDRLRDLAYGDREGAQRRLHSDPFDGGEPVEELL